MVTYVNCKQALFENYVVSEIMKKIKHAAKPIELYFLRTQDKAKIDLIVDRKTQRDLIEIKKSSTYTSKMSATLKQYAEKNDRLFVLYNGESMQQGDVQIWPYENYLCQQRITPESWA